MPCLCSYLKKKNVHCIGRQILNHWTTREVPGVTFFLNGNLAFTEINKHLQLNPSASISSSESSILSFFFLSFFQFINMIRYFCGYKLSTDSIFI